MSLKSNQAKHNYTMSMRPEDSIAQSPKKK